MALDLNSPTVTAQIAAARAALAGGDFTAAALAVQGAVDAQATHLLDIAAAEIQQEALLASLNKGLSAIVTLRDLLG